MTLNWRYYKSSELFLFKSVTVLLLTDSTHLKCPIPLTGSLYQFPALVNGSWLNGGDPISSSVFAHRARRSTLRALLFNICYITHCKTACFWSWIFKECESSILLKLACLSNHSTTMASTSATASCCCFLISNTAESIYNDIALRSDLQTRSHINRILWQLHSVSQIFFAQSSGKRLQECKSKYSLLNHSKMHRPV